MKALSPTSVWLVIFLTLVIVLALRWSFLVLPRRFQPKGALAEALSYAPLAALVAICIPEVAKFEMAQLQNGVPLAAMLTGLTQDWRFWSALALVSTVLLTKKSKSAALFGLAAAAIVIAVL